MKVGKEDGIVSFALVNGQVLQGQEFVAADVVIDGEKIKRVGRSATGGFVGEKIDLAGAKVSSGLLDLHFHGLKDKTAVWHDLNDLGRYEAEFGVTGFLAGLAAPRAECCKILEKKRLEKARMKGGARCLGFYLEGPFIALPGAILPEWIERPDVGYARELLAVGGADIKVMMVSPELPGVIGLIELLVSSGVVVALGHTDASVEQMAAAVDAGATLATHTYNVVDALPEIVEPGVWPVCGYDGLVADDRVTCELICDGIHVHPIKARITYKAKGVDRLAIITDCNTGAGLPPGRYEFPGWHAVEIRPGDAVRDAEHGWLAGSAITVDEGVRRSGRVLGCRLADACVMASRTIADVLNLGHHLGRVRPGYDADLTVLDGDGRPAMTIVAGRIVWRKGETQ